jgi:hypothetical protein
MNVEIVIPVYNEQTAAWSESPARVLSYMDVDLSFDTELLILAQRRGMRIHEVAVDWVEDRDSRVKLVPTAFADLRGMARMFVHREPEPRQAMLPRAVTR